MPRAHRDDFAGAVHHVTVRGNDGCPIYLDDGDRRSFLRRLGRIALRRSWSIHAFCLMGNHLHNLVETQHADLGEGMRDLLGGHSRWFNARHGRTGHLFGARYHSVLVRSDAQLLATARYVVLNPVRAGLCAAPEDWPWSNHAALLGLAPDGVLETTRLVLDVLSPVAGAGPAAWAGYVAAGLSSPAELTGDGSERPSIGELVSEHPLRESVEICRAAGHGVDDIAAHFGVSRFALYRQLRSASGEHPGSGRSARKVPDAHRDRASRRG